MPAEEAPPLRPIRIAALLVPAQLALAPLLPAQPAAAQRAAAEARPAELAERDLLFAHHRLRGTEPDFAALAAQDVARRPPPARPPRDPEREQRYLLVLAERRVRAEFAAFDPGTRFRLRLRTEIHGFDPARGGLPLASGLRHGVTLRHPLGGERGFSLRFRDADSLALIPAPDAEAAAGILQQAGLPSLGAWAGEGEMSVDFVLAGTLPPVPELPDTPLLARIVAAQVESRGHPLHGFAFPRAVPEAAAARRAGPPALHGAELAGLRLGMPLAEAARLALARHPRALPGGFYEGLAEEEGAAPRCSIGLVADLRAFALPLPPGSRYAACLAVQPGAEDTQEAGRVAALVQLRFLPGATAETVRAALEQEHGAPEELTGGELLWIGRDPAPGADATLLQRRALLAELAEGGPDREPGILLALQLREQPLPPEEEP